jgi:hypothetical protein
LERLKVLQAAFRGDVVLKGSPEDFQLINSREYGASRALLELAKQLGLDRALYSRNEPWVRDCLAMIVGRLLYAGSKLALSNQWKNTTLWQQCGTEGKVDVDTHCYEALDRLLERQSAIQRTLASRHLKDGHLVLYDITSSYFEGLTPRAISTPRATIATANGGMNRWSSLCSAVPKVVRWASKFLLVTLKMLPPSRTRLRNCMLNTA